MGRERPEAEMSKEGHQGPLVTGACPGGWARTLRRESCFSSQMGPCPHAGWRPLLSSRQRSPSVFPFSQGALHPPVTVSLEAWSPARLWTCQGGPVGLFWAPQSAPLAWGP